MSTTTLRPGDKLGLHEVVRVVGSGSMSTVYEVMTNGTRAALRVTNAERFESDMRPRFVSAAMRTSRLRSPRILRPLAAGAEQGLLYELIELYEGESLEALILREGRLSADDINRLVAQLCEGLAVAHEAGIVHRRLASRNVIVRSREPLDVVLRDFVIADFVTYAPGAPMVELRPKGELAPEKPTEDLQALGIVVYEALHGVLRTMTHNEAAIQRIKHRERKNYIVHSELWRPGNKYPRAIESWLAQCVSPGPNASALDAAASWPGYLAPPAESSLAVGARLASELEMVERSRSNLEDASLYANWLEGGGYLHRAAFLRAMTRHAERAEILEIPQPEAESTWRAGVSRLPIIGCEPVMEFKCPKRWEDLTPTDVATVRHCSACDKPVYFVSRLEDIEARARARQCVAFDTPLPEARNSYARWQFESYPNPHPADQSAPDVFGMVGMMHPPEEEPEPPTQPRPDKR